VPANDDIPHERLAVHPDLKLTEGAQVSLGSEMSGVLVWDEARQLGGMIGLQEELRAPSAADKATRGRHAA